jgi:hypothetical protein
MITKIAFRIFFPIILLSSFSGCASKPIASKREARIHLEAKKKVGLISIKAYPIELKKISASGLPDEPASSINEAAIERRYKKEASEWPVSMLAPITRDFNEGKINEATYLSRHRFAAFAVLAVLNRGNSSMVAPPYGSPLAFAPPPVAPLTSSLARRGGGGPYIASGNGHWIKSKSSDGGIITLEDGSVWQIDSFDRIDTRLWLPITNITVAESDGGYLLINTDDRQKAHAKLLSQ